MRAKAAEGAAIIPAIMRAVTQVGSDQGFLMLLLGTWLEPFEGSD